MQNAHIPTIILHFIKPCQVCAQRTNFSPSLVQKDTNKNTFIFINVMQKREEKADSRRKSASNVLLFDSHYMVAAL